MEEKNGLYMVAIVGIIAIVGIVVMLIGANATPKNISESYTEDYITDESGQVWRIFCKTGHTFNGRCTIPVTTTSVSTEQYVEELGGDYKDETYG